MPRSRASWCVPFYAVVVLLLLCPVHLSGQVRDNALTELIQKERKLYQSGKYVEALPLA